MYNQGLNKSQSAGVLLRLPARLTLSIFLFTAIILLSAVTRANSTNIGVVFDGSSELNRMTLETYIKEIKDLTEGEFTVDFPKDKILEADWTATGVRTAIDKLLNDPGVDIVITIGVIGSTEIAKRTNLPKPAIAPWIIDSKLLGLPENAEGTTGIHNLYYLASPTTLARDIIAFKEIVEFDNMALVFMPIVTELVPDIEDYVIQVARESGVEIFLIPVTGSVDELLAIIPPDTESVMVTPILQYSSEEIEQLYDGLIQRGLPSFSMLGRTEVEQGALIGLTPELNITRQARRIALAIQSILLGDDPANLPIEFSEQQKLTINMATAKAINFYPKWEVMTDADLIEEEPLDTGQELTLDGAVLESVRVNLDLLAADKFVSAGAQDVKRAIAELLPQSDIFLENRYIDKDRARASFGTQPERSISGGANVSQLIYSDRAWSNLTVQKRLQEARVYNRNEIRLDIIAATAIAYLNVLRAKTIERIQKDNLKLSKSNLEIAKVRRDIGVASPAEVYRWESEISSDRIDVVSAEATRKNTEILVNRLLHRPLSLEFRTQETGLGDKTLIVSDPRLDKYVDNPGSFEVFMDFMVTQGFLQSPEIKSLDSQVGAQERILKSSQRAFWIPTFSAFGEIRQFFYEGSAGGEINTGDLPFTIPSVDDTEWIVQFQATFPLFRGGAKIAEYKQAREELSRLRIERDSTSEKVEEEIRTSLNNAGASFPSIGFAEDASSAARKNLELVTDSYSRGVVSIIDLLDAQNAALAADLNAANAVYDFLIDLMNVQRSVGRFDFFMNMVDRDEWFRKLETFYNDAVSKRENGQQN